MRRRGEDPMIHHVVVMKFKRSVTDQDIGMLAKMLDDLPYKITEIHMYEFGRNLVRSEESYDFALLSLFADLQALQRYWRHPQRLPVAKKLDEICESMIRVDFESSDASSINVDRPPWEFKPFGKF
jgi:hypothetical protein